MLIDTHAHLYFAQFDEDRDEVIQRAFAANVKKIINIGIDLETCRKAMALAEKYDGLYAAVAIHPNDATKFNERVVAEIKQFSRHPKVVAIGEIGLDFYRNRNTAEMQMQAFCQQLKLAKEVDLPIIIHNRQAGREIVDVLQAEGTEGLTGVFHCFSENRMIAEAVLQLGFHISFTGNLTFKKSELPAVAQSVPLNRILLETDSPFLSPEPKRGRRNEPAHVVYIVQKLAEIKEINVSEIEQITTTNALQLFRLGDREMK